LKVYLKGQFLIDPIEGVLVHELQLNDMVYFELTDRSDVAVTVGRLLGAYKKGLWLPVKGKIIEIQDATGGRKKFRLKAAKGVFIDVLSIGDVKIRTLNLSTRERIAKGQELKADTSMIPILIAVSLLAFLIVVLMMLR
jgi:hypothetical protein